MLSPSLLPPVTFAYKQCLLQFVHHADVWYAAARYLEGVGRQLAEKQVQSTQAIAFPIPYKFNFLWGLYRKSSKNMNFLTFQVSLCVI